MPTRDRVPDEETANPNREITFPEKEMGNPCGKSLFLVRKCEMPTRDRLSR